jgi:hypothetical protein
MSGVMLAAGKLRLMGEQPPDKLVGRTLRAVGLRPAMAAAHVVYGATLGALTQRMHGWMAEA